MTKNAIIKRGRPPGRVQNRAVQMRLSDPFIEALDNWRSKQPDQPSRTEAIRILVERGLENPDPKQTVEDRPVTVQSVSRPRR